MRFTLADVEFLTFNGLVKNRLLSKGDSSPFFSFSSLFLQSLPHPKSVSILAAE